MKAIVLFVATILLVACVRGPEVTNGQYEVLPAGVWTVGGVRINDGLEQTQAILGTPSSRYTHDQSSFEIFVNRRGVIGGIHVEAL